MYVNDTYSIVFLIYYIEDDFTVDNITFVALSPEQIGNNATTTNTL